jgi:asparagine synthase (glutamine-hydrolysing)
MIERIAYRGPDDSGLKVEGPVALAHKRLSIIDLSREARQPIRSPCGRVLLTFNGEIYNFKALRKELQILGFHFKTQSDSEVLAAVLAQWREKGLEKLVGMFAFAAYFTEDKRLLLARDRTGIKPLVYQIQENCFAFASEISALRPFWKQMPELDEIALHHYLAFGHTSDLRCLLKNVNRLPAAHYLWADERKPQVYWKPSLETKNEPASNEKIVALMQQSVDDRLISDRPVSLMLSGGLDSSILAALMSHQKKDLKAFTIRYPLEKNNLLFNEFHYSQKVARHCGISLEEIPVDEEDIYDHFEKIARFFDEPNAGPAAFPLYIAFEKIKHKTTVVIDGGGADECFGGYRKYLIARAFDKTKNLPKIFQKILSLCGLYGQQGDFLFSKDPLLQVVSPQLMFSPENMSDLFLKNHLPSWMQETVAPLLPDPSLDLTTQMQYFDVKNHLLGWANSLLDRVSMAHGLECREPYQDHRLIEYIFGLKADRRYRWPQEKTLLKSALGNRVPPEILKRRKHGMGVPVKHWLRFGLKERMCDWLSSSRLEKQGIFNPKPIQNMIQSTLKVEANYSLQIWPLLLFQIWYDDFFGN